MKLMRLGPAGQERPAVVVGDGLVVDVSDAVGDFDEAFFGSGGVERLRALAVRAGGGRASPSRWVTAGSGRRSPAPTSCCASG